jgi:Domain of unknown function (DUF4442)
VKTSVTKLPFNCILGIRPASDSAYLLQPASRQPVLNHLGTVHATAQLALAEASSGEFLLRHFGSADGLVPVVRRAETKFRKPANGSIMSTASAEPEALAQVDAELSKRGRSIIQITVEIYDECGTHTLSATFDWFIQHRKNSEHGQPGREVSEAAKSSVAT